MVENKATNHIRSSILSFKNTAAVNFEIKNTKNLEPYQRVTFRIMGKPTKPKQTKPNQNKTKRNRTK